MFNGLGVASFGFSGIERPTYDYVRGGDVIRVLLNLDTAFAGLNVTPFRTALANSRGLRLVSLDQSQLGSVITGYAGPLIVTVQTLNDFARLDDVTRLVAGLAQQSGLHVLLNSSRGEFITQVEDTGGKVAPTITDQSGNKPSENDLGSSFKYFFDSLTSSPVTLAVIIGGVVILTMKR